MPSLLNLADAVVPSWVNGPGARAVLFVQGCSIRCPGCHNPHTWDTRPMYLREPSAVVQWYKSHVSLRGITLSGGEPFEQAAPLAQVCREVQELGGDVVAFSGFSYEELCSGVRPGTRELLAAVDLLIDGPFISTQRTLAPLRGSDNQRLIHLSSRITPEDLKGLPRCEWLGRENGAHVTGFQTNRLAKLGRASSSSSIEVVQNEHSGTCDSDTSD